MGRRSSALLLVAINAALCALLSHRLFNWPADAITSAAAYIFGIVTIALFAISSVIALWSAWRGADRGTPSGCALLFTVLVAILAAIELIDRFF